jgi:exodeoxyribonuclease VIII
MTDRINVMVDLETLGLGYDAPILSIGAVAFARSEVLDLQCHYGISLKDSIARGRVPSASTIQWWLQQDDAARKALDSKLVAGETVIEAMRWFADWIKSVQVFADAPVHVWGNGADFDVAMLRHAFAKTGIAEPWHYRNVRCFRTYMAEFGLDEDWVQPSVKHDALADAAAQAQTLINCWNRLGVKYD